MKSMESGSHISIIVVASLLVVGVLLGVFVDRNLLSGEQALNVAVSPSRIASGTYSNLTIGVTDKSMPIENVYVEIGGAASGAGFTDSEGQVTVPVRPVGEGNIIINASKKGYIIGTATVKILSTLNISFTPTSLFSGRGTFITFHVSSNGLPVANALVDISGAGIKSDGVTNSDGQVILFLEPASAGTISVKASKQGYMDAFETLTSIPSRSLNISANQNTVIAGQPTQVVFDVTDGNVRVSGASVSVQGPNFSLAATTDLQGKAILILNPRSSGSFEAVASKDGYLASKMVINAIVLPQLNISASPGIVEAEILEQIIFLITSNGVPVADANVNLSNVSSSGTTSANGLVIVPANASARGVLKATASKTGYQNGTIDIPVFSRLRIEGLPANLTAGVQAFVIMNITDKGMPIEGALINLNGTGVNIRGITDSNGEVIFSLNITSPGNLTAIASKSGYLNGTTTIPIN